MTGLLYQAAERLFSSVSQAGDQAEVGFTMQAWLHTMSLEIIKKILPEHMSACVSFDMTRHRCVPLKYFHDFNQLQQIENNLSSE